MLTGVAEYRARMREAAEQNLESGTPMSTWSSCWRSCKASAAKALAKARANVAKARTRDNLQVFAKLTARSTGVVGSCPIHR